MKVNSFRRWNPLTQILVLVLVVGWVCFFFFVRSSYANHWLFPVSNKPEFTIPVNKKAVTDIVLKSQSQLQFTSEVCVTSPDYFICEILILEDTLVVSMCFLILSDSPVPVAELYLPELLSVEIPALTFCSRHWAWGTAGFCSAACQQLSWAGGPSTAPACTLTAWQSSGVRQAQHDLLPSLQGLLCWTWQ